MHMAGNIPLRNTGLTLVLIGIGALGGLAAAQTGGPMPFMLGSLLVTGVITVFAGSRLPKGYQFPPYLRLAFIGIIGVMIGARVHPELLTLAGGVAVSVAAVSLFVVLAQGVNYLLFRKLGGYDPATAWFSGSPGGLIEAIAMGEAAGGDVRVLTVMQFLRIIGVVTLVPIGFSLWQGAPVGSAAGLSLSGPAGGSLAALPWVAVLTGAGLALGLGLRLPAGQITGPIVVAGAASGLGWVELDIPFWLIATAQVVLGVNLGVRFIGVSRALFVRAGAMSLLSVAAMLGIGVTLALIVARLTGLPVDMLIISYAPGGMSEMGLVAVSLASSPALVALHHLYRITLTVLLLSMARRLGVLPQA